MWKIDELNIKLWNILVSGGYGAFMAISSFQGLLLL